MAAMFNDDFYSKDEDMTDEQLYKDIMGDEADELAQIMKPAKFRRAELEKDKKYLQKMAKRAKAKKKQEAAAAEMYDEDYQEEGSHFKTEEEDPAVALARAKEELNKKMDELYNLDYEDIIGGDIPCRFKYISVPKASFGMDLEDILFEDDKELAQRVSVKKLAPYRDDVRDIPWWEMKGNRGKPAARMAAKAAKKKAQAAAQSSDSTSLPHEPSPAEQNQPVGKTNKGLSKSAKRRLRAQRNTSIPTEASNASDSVKTRQEEKADRAPTEKKNLKHEKKQESAQASTDSKPVKKRKREHGNEQGGVALSNGTPDVGAGNANIVMSKSKKRKLRKKQQKLKQQNEQEAGQ